MTKKKKTLEKKIQYLNMGLSALKNANNHYRATKDISYLLTIQSQLRGLVAMGGRSMKPLLITLSEELSIPLEFYAFSSAKEKNRTSSTVVGKTWSPLPVNGYEKYTLKDWLLLNDYYAIGSGEFKNRNQIIKDSSNFEGGTHYHEETPHIVESLTNEKNGEENNLTSNLLDTAEAVYFHGVFLLLRYEYMSISKTAVLSNRERLNQLSVLKIREDKHKSDFALIKNYGQLNGIFVGSRSQ